MSIGKPESWENAVRSLLESPDQQQIVRDCYYDQPNIVAARRYEASEEWSAVRSLLPAAARSVVDVGSGHGITAFALACAGLDVTGVEPNPSALVGRAAIASLASESGLPIRVAQGTAESIPAPDASFELAVARQVLHHTRDIYAACREIHRVLKPGATFIALRDHVVSSPSDLPRFFDSHPLHRRYCGENAFRLSEYLGALRDAGFVIVDVLRAFDSVINYAPHTRETLRSAFISLAGHVPLGRKVFGALLKSDLIFDGCIAAASRLDHRPGRLVSIICRRPADTNDG